MKTLARSVEMLLDLLAPARCTVCALEHPTFPPRDAGQIDSLLCDACADTLEPPDDPPPTGVIAPYAHQGAFAHAIHRAKYGDSPHIARRVGALLAHRVRAELPDVQALVPVPLHRKRLATRGYNQAYEIARAFGISILEGEIVRTRDTPSQVGRGRSERLENVRGAFAVKNPGSLAGLSVLVVDDVVTTGATLAGVAEAVRQAGAVRVHMLAASRAPLEH